MAWFRDPLRLTVLYGLGFVLAGMPIVWVYDPEGTYGLFGGLILGAVTFLVPTGFYLILPRRWGMALFGLESVAIWTLCLVMFDWTDRYRDFIMWSVIELPMYGLELLGLLHDPKASSPPPPPATSPLLFVWIALIVAAYVIGYPYDSADQPVTRPEAVRTIALLLVPIPYLIVLRNVIRRLAQAKALAVPAHPAAG